MKERLQKIVAKAGIASRRRAEELIRQGQVAINGRVVTELGSQADTQKDEVEVGGKSIRAEPLEYYVLNKPRGVLSSASDPLRRPVATQLVKSQRRLYPTGRLDFQSEGLIILTNDGKLARRVTRAGTLKKVYEVKVRGRPSHPNLQRLREGIKVGGEQWGRCRITPLKEANHSWYEVVLCEGKNRQIRRMFDRIGHPVMRLRRIAIGPLQLGKLPSGSWRRMTTQEVRSLKKADGRASPDG